MIIRCVGGMTTYGQYECLERKEMYIVADVDADGNMPNAEILIRGCRANVTKTLSYLLHEPRGI